MTDITEFLATRWDEAEAIAKAAASQASFVAVPGNDEGDPGPWCATQGGEGVTTENAYASAPFLHAPQGYSEPNVVKHIAAHDPARVLADLAAKRAIVVKCQEQLVHPHSCPVGRYLARDTLKLLAAPYADHPDFDEAWRLADV